MKNQKQSQTCFGFVSDLRFLKRQVIGLFYQFKICVLSSRDDQLSFYTPQKQHLNPSKSLSIFKFSYENYAFPQMRLNASRAIGSTRSCFGFVSGKKITLKTKLIKLYKWGAHGEAFY